MANRVAYSVGTRLNLRSLCLTAILVSIGLGLTGWASWMTWHNSVQMREQETLADAQRISAELSYRVLRNREPLIAVHSLYAGSDGVTQAELELAHMQIRSITKLDVDHSIAFVVAGVVDLPGADPAYHSPQVVGNLAILPPKPGQALDARLLPAINAAKSAPGELLLAAIIEDNGNSYLPIVLSAANAAATGTLLYVIDLSQLLASVSHQLLEPGASFSLFHPVSGNIVNPSMPALNIGDTIQHRVDIDMGLYHWQLLWLFDANTSDQNLALTMAITGTLMTLMLAYIFYSLLHQRQLREQLITRKTHQLEETQSLLVKREKMAALGQMVAGISHELHTPIGNGLLAATLLRTRSKDLAQTLADRSGLVTEHDRDQAIDAFITVVSESTRLIEKNIQRATELIRSFKQVAVDQSSERRRRFNLAETLEELAQTLAPGLRAERLQFTLEIPSGINMDSYPGALYQVVSNLVSNAMTHAYNSAHDERMPWRGELLLRVTSLDKENILMLFSDDGCGIEESAREHVFDPFFTTRMGAGGSGLGLHIVYTLITEVLGGTIKLARADNGCLFRITLPVTVPEAGQQR